MKEGPEGGAGLKPAEGEGNVLEALRLLALDRHEFSAAVHEEHARMLRAEGNEEGARAAERRASEARGRGAREDG